MKKFCSIAFICLAAFVSNAQSPRILVPFRVGNKWGYSDTSGRIKIQPKYDSVSLFNYHSVKKGNAIATVLLNKKQAVINDKGGVLVPPEYDHIAVFDDLSEDFVFVVFKKTKAGLVNKGKEMISPLYDELFRINGNYFQVKKDGRWGVLDPQGKVVLPVVHKEIWQAAGQPGFITMQAFEEGELKSFPLKINETFFPSNPAPVNELEGIISFEEALGKTIEEVTKDLRLDSLKIKDNSAIVYKDGRQGIILPREGKKVYFFSKTYSIHQIKYLSAGERSAMNKSAAYIVVSFKGKYGVVNETEKQVLPFRYDGIEERDDFFLLKQNGKVGFFILNTPYPVIQPAFDKYIKIESIEVNHQRNFILFEVMKNGHHGFAGENGIPFFKN